MSANNFEDNAKLIRTTFDTAWAAAFAPSAAPTVIHDEQRSADHLPVQSKDYLRFIVRETTSIAVSCGAPGNRRWRTYGIAKMQILSALTSSKTARQYADIVAHIFRGARLTAVVNGGLACNISFDAPVIQVFGIEGSHSRAWLSAPFKYDFVE